MPLLPMPATCPAHLILLDLIIIIFIKNVSYEASHYAVSFNLITISFLLGPNILLSALFSNAFYLFYFLNVTVQVSYPYKNTGKIMVLYIY
jgi:hypothetical protein